MFRLKFFKYSADRLPVFFITLLFIADLWAYFAIQTPALLISWACLALIPKMFVGSWNHHHQHVNTFEQTFLNRLLEVIYTFHTGVTTNVWVLHHNLGHHLNYLDQTKDESAWLRKDGTKMGIIEYTLTIGITGYLRSYRVGKNYPKFQNIFFAFGAVNLILLCALIFHNPLNALVIFLIPMTLVYLGTCWLTFYHHSGLHSDDPFSASHNCTHKFYNVITGNLGYHTAHHLKQGLHWSKLPELHRTIENKIPAHLISPKVPWRAELHN